MRSVKRIKPHIADKYLNTIGMKIGQWNQIESVDAKLSWLNYRAPRDADKLFMLSQYAAGWLPRGEWKLLQMDNSTRLSAVEASLVNRLLGNTLEEFDFNLVEDRSYLMEFGDDSRAAQDTELLMGSLIFTFLLFQQHAYLVSSNSAQGQLLGIQDGDLCFMSRAEDMSDVNKLLKIYEDKPTAYPEWASTIIREMQEREMQGV